MELPYVWTLFRIYVTESCAYEFPRYLQVRELAVERIALDERPYGHMQLDGARGRPGATHLHSQIELRELDGNLIKMYTN